MALTRIQPPAIADVREPNFRNIVINGDMAISQRSTSEASLTSSGYNTLDRYRCVIVTAGTWTQSQDTDVPTGSGFANSMKWDCTTADASLGASDLITIQQFVEGQNVQYLKKGTSDAVPITLSFWVKSVLTGTYICEIGDSDNSRSISASYTISSASTWEYKTLTFPGDTTGAFTNDNGASLTVQFCLGAGTDYTSGSLATSWGTTTTANRYVGQVNLASSTSNNFWLTGVQLEAGSVATDFEVVPYGQNLQRCYRYYFEHSLGDVGGYGKRAGISTTFAILESSFYTVPMRAAASMSSGTPTFLNCSTLTLNSFDGGKSYMCRVTSSNSSEYRAYETTVEHNAEL
jgi:hypothetical protein